mgnify:CR=1 FL=1
MKLYSDLAEYYFSIEKKHRNINEDIAFVRSLFPSSDGLSVLDIGCGSGEHLGILKGLGMRCTGLDSSPEMLAVARKRFPEGVAFIQADMKDFDFYEEFDLVMCLFGSLNYMIEDEDVERALWNAWRAMKPGGVGIFEVWHDLPIVRIKKKDPGLVSQTRYNEVTIDRMRGFSLLPLPGRSLVEVSYVYDITGESGSKTVRDRHIMRPFSRQEMMKFLGDGGFTMQGIYSNFKKELFSENSVRMVIVFTKE